MEKTWETADGPKVGEVIVEEPCVGCGERIFWLKFEGGGIQAVNDAGEGHWNQWDICHILAKKIELQGLLKGLAAGQKRAEKTRVA